MSKSEDLYDRVIFGFARRFSGRVVAVVALAIYLAGLLVPLLLSWSAPYQIAANLWATVIAGSMALGWLIVQLEARDRRHLVEWTTNLRHLNAAEFEWLVAELFRREGWSVEHTGRQDEADGNIDLVLTGPRGRAIVQCKRWSARHVGVDDVRVFAGTLLEQKMAGQDGKFVSLSGYTPAAVSFAQQSGIELLDSVDLFARIEKVRRTEPCPRCGSAMVLGRSDYGWWFRCVRQGCGGKRDLGRAPGLAVDLLTQAPERV
jgi:hypothetical protein